MLTRQVDEKKEDTVKKLTKAQVRAHDKLLRTGMASVCGRSPYELQESIATLDALVAMGLAVREAGLGSTFDPRTGLKYRLR